MPPPAIHTRDLTRSYGSSPVLRGLDLDVDPGSVFGLLGPNGAGKTTLVRVLSTLLAPDTGIARILGHDVVQERREVRAVIGLTGQYASVDELLTGEENLVQLARLLGFGRADARRRAHQLLERFDLAESRRVRVSAYSGGMRRRLDLAASLIARPAVLFLDEPTTGLDPRSRRTLWDSIRELAADGTTILLTTQYLEEADLLADRIGVLDAGHLVVEGTPRELKRRVGQERLTVTVPAVEHARAQQLLDTATGDGPAGDGPASNGLTGDGRADDGPCRDHEGRSHVHLPLWSPEHLRDVLTLLHVEGVTVLEVHLEAPSLDDVFLSLTGRSTAAEVAA